MPTSLCSSSCCYFLSLWEWWTDTCVQYNHLKDAVHSSSFAVFLEQSLHCCYQIPSRTVTSATQLNPLPSTVRLGVALSSQRVIRMLPCQYFPILQLCPQSQGIPTRAPTRVTICHPPYHSRGQPPIICTAWQLLRISGTPNPSFNADFHSLILVRLQSLHGAYPHCLVTSSKVSRVTE